MFPKKRYRRKYPDVTRESQTIGGSRERVNFEKSDESIFGKNMDLPKKFSRKPEKLLKIFATPQTFSLLKLKIRGSKKNGKYGLNLPSKLNRVHVEEGHVQ